MTNKQAHESVRVAGLRARAEIVRDRWGIPHIRASSLEDAFFAQGFAHAHDRLWQMEWDRRRAYGRTAELLGAARIDADRLARRLQIERAARVDWQMLADETRAMLESFTAGVNACIETLQIASLPIEFQILQLQPEPWRPWDCISLFKIHHALMGLIYNKLWRLKLVLQLGVERVSQLFLDDSLSQPVIIPPDGIYRRAPAQSIGLMEAAQELPGVGDSNNWLLDGTRTASGKPLLAGDPHRAIDVPNVFYQNHLACDVFDAIGVSFPGVPALSHQGHNGRVAWSVTHAQSDYQDLYIEKFDAAGTRYEQQGAWHDAEISEERIRVKDGADVSERVRRTRHGPVVEDGPWPQHALALRYVGFEAGKTFDCFLPMLRARSCDELRASQREWVHAGQCLIFADVENNTGMLMRGKLPIRARANAWLPVPGWTGAHEWQGFVPFEELPQLSNPSAHMIVTANNKIVGDDYAHHVTLDAGTGHRAARIAQLLAPLTNATADDFARIQADRLSLPASELTPLLLQAADDDADVQRACAYLRAWDFRMEADSVAATLYTVTRDKLLRAWLEPLLGAELVDEILSGGRGASSHITRLRSHLPRLIAANDTRLLPAGAQWPALLNAALRGAIAALRARLGDEMDQWQWGRLHRTRLVHPLAALDRVGESLNPPQVACGGDGDTVRNAGYAAARGFAVGGTQVYRQIIDLGDLSRSRWVVPLGASGRATSAHYADQQALWRDGGSVPMLYAWDAINAEGGQSLVLSPE